MHIKKCTIKSPWGDDFGTGYSSLAYIKNFAIDQIKMDKDFIKHIDSEIKDQVIVKALTDIADGIQSDLIAEGVETKNQFDYLSQKGCTKYQGYYFEKPISADVFFRKYITVINPCIRLYQKRKAINTSKSLELFRLQS